MKVRFLSKDLEYTFTAGESVLKMGAKAGVDIDGNCAGNGTCGKCKVKIVSGNDEILSAEEKLILTEAEIKDGYRLACKFHPQNDVVIGLPKTEGTLRRKTKLAAMPEHFVVKNQFRKEYICIEASTIENQISDLDKIKKLCGMGGKVIICPELLRYIPDILTENRNATVTLYENEIVDIEPNDTTAYCYGLAVDIGTTTVVGHLWNLLTGDLIEVNAVANPQGAYGADVISRIAYAKVSMEQLNRLHRKIIDCINGMIAEFAGTHHIKPEHIYCISVVGNTTMSHLFLGINPKQLAVSPFSPVFVNSITDSTSKLGIQINKYGKFYLLPNIAGHVGSDITAGVISTGILKKEGVHLMIDIGTNGEIVLSGKEMPMTCSTAAGPAFEGASIFKGMRAAEGAIEKIRIDDDVHIQVIGNKVPIGICGSGIIDSVAQLLLNGLIDSTGKFIKAEAMKEKNIPESIISRFRKSERGNEFVLAFNSVGDDVVVLQKDIREVQLAKAAIYSGIRIMMNRMGITDDDLEEIHIAGAFGNYIDIESALTIGLLPKINKNKIISEGNAAGAGASMALLSSDKREEAEMAAEAIAHIELAACPDFQEEYLQAMYF